MRFWYTMIAFLLLFAFFLFPTVATAQEGSPVIKVPELTEMEEEQGIMLTEMGVRYIVHPDDIVSGGPPMDGIPSIDDPKFVTVEEANQWIADNELVLGLIYNNTYRVYPLQVMTWHEIVNEEIGGEPILITYCPLCGSGIAYKRTINGEAVEFGTSGKLYNSNLVMYDRKTNSYWTQIGGQAIVGELTGMELVPISIDTVSWREWKAAYPDSEVLSKDTGFDRPYGNDPYANYYENSFVFFPVEETDQSIHPKTVVFGIEVNGTFKAYLEDDLIETGEIEDTIAGVDIRIKRDEAGVVTVKNLETSEEIVKERDFWFAWYAFHPDTGLYMVEDVDDVETEPSEGESSPSLPVHSILAPVAILLAFIIMVKRSGR